MSLPQGWIEMIQPELHKTHPFLVLRVMQVTHTEGPVVLYLG